MSETDEQKPFQPDLGSPQALSPKPYEQPRLLEWGSLSGLTQGLTAANDDYPADGGTQVQ